MNIKPWSLLRSAGRPTWRRLLLLCVLALTPLTGVIALGAAPASASYVPQLSVSISITLTDPGDCLKHTFLVRVGSDAGHPSGTVDLIANGRVLQSQAVPAGGSFTMTVASSELLVGTDKVTASFVPTDSATWKSATGSVVISNLSPVDCQPLINTGGTGTGPLIDTGRAPDPASGFPLWLVEAGLCLVIAAGGLVALRAPRQ